MINLLVDTHENRDVATADEVGTYLLADLNDFVLVNVTGTSANMMCEVDPSFTSFITNKKGRKTRYLQLTKALYGCMQSAFLWYQTFKEYLEQFGFELNPYKPCITNKNINGIQCTVCWYVDDTKILHKDSDVVDSVIQQIENKFGKMIVTCGKNHTFVGIDIEFVGDKTI